MNQRKSTAISGQYLDRPFDQPNIPTRVSASDGSNVLNHDGRTPNEQSALSDLSEGALVGA